MTPMEVILCVVVVVLLVLNRLESADYRKIEAAYYLALDAVAHWTSLCEDEQAARAQWQHKHAAYVREIDAVLERLYGVPMTELAYATQLDAIADLRRKGVPKLRYFDAPPEMLDAQLAEGRTELGKAAAATREALAEQVMHGTAALLAAPSEVHFSVEQLPTIELTLPDPFPTENATDEQHDENAERARD